MIQSMTGFSRVESQGPWGRMAWELRSVNHRYLEIQLRLPEEFRSLEAGLREQLGQALGRGKVDVSLRWDRDAGESSALAVNEALVSQLRNVHQQVAELLDSDKKLKPADVLRWPGVVREAERELEAVHAAGLALLDQAIAELKQTRGAEGERIAAMLRQRSEQVSGIVKLLRTRMPEIRDALKQKFLARLSELEIKPDPDRLEQELVFHFQKLDVDEELDRLESHVTELLDILKRDEPVGRRLDFLMQEFNREANTLGSKSQAVDSTRAAVDLKVLIEQMREQIQNIE